MKMKNEKRKVKNEKKRASDDALFCWTIFLSVANFFCPQDGLFKVAVTVKDNKVRLVADSD